MHYEYRLVYIQPGVLADFELFREILENEDTYSPWEPYAVTWDGTSHVQHLRRKIYS
jgi:hypothetical protein